MQPLYSYDDCVAIATLSHFTHLSHHLYDMFYTYKAIVMYILCCKPFHYINSTLRKALNKIN
jgi:hypothetical protein